MKVKSIVSVIVIFIISFILFSYSSIFSEEQKIARTEMKEYVVEGNKKLLYAQISFDKDDHPILLEFFKKNKQEQLKPTIKPFKKIIKYSKNQIKIITFTKTGRFVKKYKLNGKILTESYASFDNNRNWKEDEFGTAKYYRKSEIGKGDLISLKYRADKSLKEKIIYKYNEAGKLISRESYDEKGNLKDTLYPARSIYKYDSTGRRILTEYFGKDGKLKNDFRGIARYSKQYDENCLKHRKKDSDCISLSEEYGENGILKNNPQYARKVSKFDSSGNLILEEFYKFNEAGDGNGSIEKISQNRYEYDQNCLKLLTIAQNYDNAQCRTLIEYYGNPITYRIGLPIETKFLIAFDDKGRETLRESFTKDGNPYSKKISKYSDNCIKIHGGQFSYCHYSEEFYERENSKNLKLVSKVIYDYAQEKQILLFIKRYDESGNLKNNEDGIAQKVYRYDKNGVIVEWKYLDANGKLKKNIVNSARSLQYYDENCLKIKKQISECISLEEFYGEDGNLVESDDDMQAAKIVKIYDEKGNLKVEEHYDVNGKLKNPRGTIYLGVGLAARTLYYYDKLGNNILLEGYNSNSQVTGAAYYLQLSSQPNQTEKIFIETDRFFDFLGIYPSNLIPETRE